MVHFSILKFSLIIFITQLIFVGCRTWNIKSIADKNIPQVLISGIFIHISWLVSIAIGTFSMHEIITKFEWKYLPIVFGSLLGGLLGSYISMKTKK